jgi:hypothetical protein
MPHLVYWNAKLTNTGVVGYKVFENCNRSVHHNSLKNLLHVNAFSNESLRYLIAACSKALTDDERSRINDEAVTSLCKDDFETYLQHTKQHRKLNPGQSRRIKAYARKLEYYTATRKFESKKSGKYQMKVAFLTLTCPEGVSTQAACNAFNHFLDYLRRTANCVFVWKKELGETNGHLHFHIMINNFIPYYIVSWKWKRLLLQEGVTWPCKPDGSPTESHYRIELPRSRKQAAHYIAKYMSKAYDLPSDCGYIAGHSKVLDELKEFSSIIDDLPSIELSAIRKASKVIDGDFVSLFCIDLLKCSRIAPQLHAVFEEQYISFSQRITLPQKFNYV